jgi:hypothetical protein
MIIRPQSTGRAIRDDPMGLCQPALLYVDLRDALHTGQRIWRRNDYPKGSIAITQAFSFEDDDLVASVLK